MKVSQKYLKDETNTTISPVTSTNSVYNSWGNNIVPCFARFGIDYEVKLSKNSTDWNYFQIPWNYAIQQINDKFTVNRDKSSIVIDKYVSYVAISMSFSFITDSTSLLEFNPQISQYDSSGKFKNMVDSDFHSYGMIHVCQIPYYICSVEHGDYFVTKVYSSYKGSITIQKAYSHNYFNICKYC